MKLNSGNRVSFFTQARALSTSLGDMFQNPLELTPEMIQQEIDETRRLKQQEMARYESYIWKLGELLCFPENFKP